MAMDMLRDGFLAARFAAAEACRLAEEVREEYVEAAWDRFVAVRDAETETEASCSAKEAARCKWRQGSFI